MKRSIVDHRLVESMAKALSCRAIHQRRTPGRRSKRGRGSPEACAWSTCERRTPMARKEALGYCRRCLAVMLCCVMVFGLTVRTAPRVEAVAGGLAAAAVAGSSGVAASDIIGSVLGLQALTAAGGIDLTMDVEGVLQEKIDVAQRMGYKWGWQVDAYLRGDDVDEASKSEWDRLVESFKTKGGVAPGDSIVLSQGLAETIRQWSLVNFDFMDGALSFEDDFLFGENDVFVLTKVDATELEAYTGTREKGFSLPLQRAGTRILFHAGDFSASYTYEDTVVDKLIFKSTYTKKESAGGCTLGLKVNIGDGVLNGSWRTSAGPSMACNYQTYEAMVDSVMQEVMAKPATLFYSNDRIYAGTLYAPDGFVAVSSRGYVTCDNLQTSTVTTTFTPTPNLTTPVAKDITMTVPADLPVVNVGEYSVPAIGTLTGEELTGEETGEKNPAVPGTGVTAADIEKAIANALPITGAIAGDQVVEEAMTEPDSLGAVFISKFPFCIPWDVAKAITLLAVPPTPPKFEFNMYSAMEGYGGFHCDTLVVIDFEPLEPAAAIVRWASTLGFVYALAMGTKRLIWTA